MSVLRIVKYDIQPNCGLYVNFNGHWFCNSWLILWTKSLACFTWYICTFFCKHNRGLVIEMMSVSQQLEVGIRRTGHGAKRVTWMKQRTYLWEPSGGQFNPIVCVTITYVMSWGINWGRNIKPRDLSIYVTRLVNTNFTVWLQCAGNLQFVNIIADDAKNGVTYGCVAENKVLRSTQQGEFNMIRPTGGGYIFPSCFL